MQKYKRILILTAVGLALPVSLISLKGQEKTKSNQKSLTVLRRADQTPSAPTEDEILGELPVAEAFPAEATDPQTKLTRQKKSARYDKLSSHEITEAEYPLNVTLNTHWAHGLTALPVDESDAVVLAHITNSQAFLSNDRTGVYSEFTANVKEVLKNVADSPLDVSATITIQRLGGAVRFPSGTIQRYTVSGQRMPLTGRTYVLFLKRTEQNDFSLITGYELRGRRVKPLDGSVGSRLPFEIYRDVDVDSFLAALRANPASEGHLGQTVFRQLHFTLPQRIESTPRKFISFNIQKKGNYCCQTS